MQPCAVPQTLGRRRDGNARPLQAAQPDAVALLADRVVEREVQGLHRTDPAALVESFLTDTYRDPAFDTEAAQCTLRDHVLAGQLATGRPAEDARCHSGAEVTAGRDTAGAYGRPDRLDTPGAVIVAGIGG
jgi:hypothetical protein